MARPPTDRFSLPLAAPAVVASPAGRGLRPRNATAARIPASASPPTSKGTELPRRAFGACVTVLFGIAAAAPVNVVAGRAGGTLLTAVIGSASTPEKLVDQSA